MANRKQRSVHVGVKLSGVSGEFWVLWLCWGVRVGARRKNDVMVRVLVFVSIFDFLFLCLSLGEGRGGGETTSVSGARGVSIEGGLGRGMSRNTVLEDDASSSGLLTLRALPRDGGVRLGETGGV